MSATTSSPYEHHAWAHDRQQRATEATASPHDFSAQQWSAQNFDTISDGTHYSPMLYQASSGTFSNQTSTMDNGNLYPTTSMASTTANEIFSPSEYASDTANFGDAFSDISATPFENTFAPYQAAHMQDTAMNKNLLSSPDATSTQNLSPRMSFPAFDVTQDMTIPHINTAVSSNSYADTDPSIQKTTRPQLVVTIDEFDSNEAIEPARRRNSSRAHLSPYPDEDEISDEDEPASFRRRDQCSVGSQASPTSYSSTSARAGVAPSSRRAINSEKVPSLDDLEKQHRLEEKNAEVEDWLSNSEVGSNGGSSAHRRRGKQKRPRAKSTNDRPFEGPRVKVPGPGLTINVPSELDDEEDCESLSGSNSPVANIETGGEAEGYFSLTSDEEHTRPVTHQLLNDQAGQKCTKTGVEGITANMAIMRFRQRAQDIDNASVTATLGSRRLSESDIGSIRGSAGISKLLLSPQQSERAPRRKNSFLTNILPKFHDANNKLKRKNSHPAEKVESPGTGDVTLLKDAQSTFAAPKRMGSFGRPKTPKVDTTVQTAAHETKSPKGNSGPATMVRQIFRSRSRSELGKPPQGGLADLMTKHGGPPIPTLASPLQPRGESILLNSLRIPQLEDESDNEDGATAGDGLTMDLTVRTEMVIIPNYEGFKDQARQLNPRIQDFLLERVVSEQVKRYKRLVETKTKHTEHVASNSCNAKGYCLLSGGSSKDLPPRPGNKDPENALVGFLIMRPGMTDDDLDIRHEGQTMVAAQFPSGVPLPPVPRLPAEFECPLCFKVKKFFKPSDWTKHVHEDVQPFVCTFEGCNESKPFKRKADWVRHENERHRQLESWMCSIQDCNHTCYRKDNFVQHLVREHKVPDPKTRTGRAGSTSQAWPSTALADEGVDDVWALVDKCRRDSPKSAKDEPCKFCGNVCTHWRKLNVHLAKHMEQISMPILPLVEQKRTGSLAFAHQRTQTQPLSMQATKPFDQLPTFLYAEPLSFEAEPQSLLGIDQTMIPSTMHTYPPPTTILQSSMPTMQADLTASALNMANASYPPPSVVSHSRASSFNEHDFSTRQQGTTYPPIGLRNLNASTPPQFDNSSGQQQMYFPQHAGMSMQEPLPMNNVYLTPTSNTPASMGYSPRSSTHSLHQNFGFP